MKTTARSGLTKSIFLSTALFVFIRSAAIAAPQFLPVMSGYFSMGQWYFEGEKSALGGNAGITYVPAIRYSNRFSLIPTLETTYRGTRSAEELAGGSTLFQDTWENGVSLKAVHGLDENWKVRERMGFRSKWFRETTNESWNKGLYDYRILTVGAEVEREWSRKTTMTLGYDFSLLQFPNYDSLESSQSGDNARELAGKKFLDNNMHLLSLRLVSPLFWRVSNQIQFLYSPRTYTDQRVVGLSGLFIDEKRKDRYFGTTVSLERVFRTPKKTNLISTLRYGYTDLDSNQNHYDARATTFIPNFYDYREHSVGPSLTFAFGNSSAGPMFIETGYVYSRRNYRERVVQSSDGAYLSDKIYILDDSFNIGFSYPFAKNLRLKATAVFGRSKSNNQYEAVYRYNYNNANYQFGFTYDY